MTNKCGLVGFCPLCYSNRKGRSNYRGHWGWQRAAAPDRRAATMRRPNNHESERLPTSAMASPGKWGEGYPSLWAFLADPAFDDGSPRTTGTVMLFCEQGRLKAWVHDREMERTAFLTARCPEDLFAELNDGLETDDMDWRSTVRKQGGKHG